MAPLALLPCFAWAMPLCLDARGVRLSMSRFSKASEWLFKQSKPASEPRFGGATTIVSTVQP